ncbi:MAG: hypothetical protein ACE5G0_00380 [Rhodothermales bacterium]
MHCVLGKCSLALLLVLVGCEPTAQTEESGGAPSVQTSIVPSEAVIASRVQAATARLEAGEAGALVLAAIEKHGGLARWYANGPLFFRFNYRPQGRQPIDTYQIVDTWSSRASHRLAADSSMGFGWDGQRAWRLPPEVDLPTNARFWALTPYYFIGVPFVLGDPGVVLHPDGEMDFEDRTYDLVRVTFEAGTGDAPDDYYVVLIDRQTRRIGGMRYVVSYPGFFPEGGHSAESFIVYDGEQEIDGILFPQTFRTFQWSDEDGPGALKTETSLTDVAFRPNTSDDAFHVPEGAEVLEGY